MIRIIGAALIIVGASNPAWAQLHTGRSVATEPLTAPYTTATGETVPHPGAPQSGGMTSLDRRIEHTDNRIDHSICRGC